MGASIIIIIMRSNETIWSNYDGIFVHTISCYIGSCAPGAYSITVSVTRVFRLLCSLGALQAESVQQTMCEKFEKISEVAKQGKYSC